MAASDNRSSSSLSMSALVSSAIGLQAGFSTNCRRHALQAYLALPLWICPFRTTRLEPQLGHLGRGCFSLIPPLYNHYPLITIEFRMKLIDYIQKHIEILLVTRHRAFVVA